LETFKPIGNIANVKDRVGNNSEGHSGILTFCGDDIAGVPCVKSHHLFEYTLFVSAYVPQKDLEFRKTSLS
jgi:hypothetical protein